MIIAAAFLLVAALAMVGAVTRIERAVRRVEAAADRVLAHLAADNRSLPEPKPQPGPLTTDTMEPEDEAVIKRRNRRGYFA